MISSNITIEGLRKLKTVYSANTKSRWKEVTHIEVIDTIEEIAKRLGWRLGDWRIGLSKDKGDMCAGAEAAIPEIWTGEESIIFGVINSTVRRRRIRTCGGSISKDKVVILSDEKEENRFTHSRSRSIIKDIKHSMKKFAMEARNFAYLVSAYKSTSLTPEQYSHFLIESCSSGIIPWTRLAYAPRLSGEISTWDLLLIFSDLVSYSPVIDTRGSRSQVDQMLALRELVTPNTVTIMVK